MSDYQGQRVVLLTQHGKETVVAPALASALGCQVERVGGFDTDQLGTFSREQPRPGTQLEAARRKARIGMTLTGCPIGLGSEGSFGPDPITGLFSWNTELLVLLDDRLGLEVVGMAQGAGHAGHLQTAHWEEARRFAERQGFPAQGLVLRPQDEDDPRLLKDLSDWAGLQVGFERCRDRAENGQVFLENDLRAFANPQRMARIGQAAQDLAQRLRSRCPACQAPGYGVVQREGRLPCRRCGGPSSLWQGERWRCVRCTHAELRLRADRRWAEPQHCERCNP